jgi:major membrane immunogen (membrane-anchored lipoprotein)
MGREDKMKRTLLSILVCGLLLLTACGKSTTTQNNTNQSTSTTQPSNSKQYSLNITIDPVGSGVVTPPSGPFKSGTIVTLVENANAGYTFDHWGGDITGNYNFTNITMDKDKNVTAYFKAGGS